MLWYWGSYSLPQSLKLTTSFLLCFLGLPGTYPLILLLLLFSHFLGHKWKTKDQESGSQLKTYVGFFRPDLRQRYRLYLAGLSGKVTLLTPGWLHCKHYSPGSELRQGFRSLWLVILFHIFAFLALAPSFLGLFIQGLEQRISSGVSAETSFTGRGGRKLEDLVPHSASVPSTFLLLVLPLCPPPTIPVTPESVELQDYFAWNFFCNEMTFMSLLVHLILD